MPLTARSLLKSKSLAAHYTPNTLAGILAEWVVLSGNERILEPSAGGGALIDAAVEQAELIGHAVPRFLACDIDGHVIERLRSRLPPSSEARAVDFLQLDPATTGPFTAVLMNPPFTRNHSIRKPLRSAIRERFDVEGASGLWVHFLLHAVDFLSPGGRLAAIIPASGLFTNYGQIALSRLCAQFGRVELREIVDRTSWDGDAEERGAILLAAEFLAGSSEVPQPSRWLSTGLPAPEIILGKTFDSLNGASEPLGGIARISIGAVTGENRVFLLNEAERVGLGIGLNEVQTIASRARHVPGLRINPTQLRELADAGEPTWLLTPPDLSHSRKGARARLAGVSRSSRRNKAWLNKRDPWWKVDPGQDCDAILTYMNNRGPRLVLAEPGVKCTNTLHHVRFNSGLPPLAHYSAVLTLISTFGQLSAELIGRKYGGGVLKFELKDARRLPVLPTGRTDLPQLVECADRLIREGKADEATYLVDDAIVQPLVGRVWTAERDRMTQTLSELRSTRCGKTIRK